MKKLIVLNLLLIVGFGLNAQLVTQGGFNAQQLATILAGPGFTINNASISGSSIAYGKFSNGNTTNIGLGSGVLLTTGSRQNAVGPNNATDATQDNFAPGNPTLDQLAGTQTFDAVVLQFDFTVESNYIQFKYVWASEEYPEFAPPNQGTFNDVFAFYISGPGIVGQRNIALVPNTQDIVSIDNINPVNYWQYYVDNTNGASIQYDGFTTVLTAKAENLIPCETYTLKLMIADAADGFYDSGVFLLENSLTQGVVSAVTNTVSGDSVALEGCIQASFTFSLDTALTTPTVIPLGIGGSAINGVDYSYIDSIITIPAGQTSVTLYINAIADGITEGQESVLLYFSPEPCAAPDTVRLYINDNSSPTFSSTVTDVACQGDSTGAIQFNISGGTSPYTIVLNQTDTFNVTNVTNLPAGTYHVEILDNYGCGGQAQVIGGQFNGGPIFLPDGQGGVYQTTIPISGFSPGQTLTNVNQIQSICLSLEHSFIGEVEIRLYAPNGSYIVLKERPGGANANFGEPVANGPVDTNNPDTTQGVCYTYCFTNNPIYGTMVSEANNHTYTYVDAIGTTLSDKYLPSGSYQPFQSFQNLIGTPLNGNWTVWVRDYNPNDNGWICDWEISLSNGNQGDSVVIEELGTLAATGVVNNASCGSSNGSINLTASGSNSPFTFAWSNGASTEDISGIGAGSYTVTVTNNVGCQYDTTFLVQNTATLSLAGVVSQVSCPGGSNGAIDITPSGGTPGYTYAWSNGASTQDIQNLVSGTYTVTVTDQAGCQRLFSGTVATVPALHATAALTNERCGDENGIIDISLTGGTAPFSYVWSNGATTQDIQMLQAGNYTVTVTDANGCNLVRTFALINEVGNCVVNCNLAIQSGQVTNEQCGNHSGAINLNYSTTAAPATFAWSNGATTEDLNGLQAGTYTVTVTDNNNCTATQSFTVSNQTSGLAANVGQTSQEYCGNGQGSISLNVTGGAQPYSYSWSNGATTATLNGLSAGNYAATVTDGSGCQVVVNSTITNNSGNLAQTYGNALNETCGNSQGSIDITIAGGAAPYTYAWSNGASTQDLLNIGAGTYQCTVTDQNGCQISTPQYIVQNNAGTLAIIDTDLYDETCSNGAGAINLDISGGNTPYSYIWNNGATTQDLSNLAAGTYSCTVTDNNGCQVNTGNLVIQNNAGTLAASLQYVQNELCGNGNGSVNINVAGGTAPYTYQWSNGSISQDLYNLSAGTYSCTVSDQNGCETVLIATVNNTQGSLSINNAIVTNESCGNGLGAIDLVVAGGTSPLIYSWSNGATSQDLLNISAGTYMVTVTDAGGCSSSQSVSVGNNAGSLQVSTISQVNAACGASNGSIDIQVSGGAAGYTYSWSNGASSQDLNGLAPGTYSCTITDQNNCAVHAGPYVIANGAGNLVANIASVTDESCGNTAGAVDLSVNGGNQPFTYVWSNGASTQDLSGLASGSYSVTVTDVNGCSTTANATVGNQSGTLSQAAVQITDAVCGNSQGAVDITISGGTSPFTYNWSNGSTSQDISGVAAGSYSCTVTDASGCHIQMGPFQVANRPGTLSVQSILAANEICGNGQGLVNLSIAGGTGTVTYLWSNGATTQDLNNVPAGNYQVTITDGAGCSTWASTTVTNDPGSLVLLGDSIVNATCSNANGQIFLQLVGNSGPMSFVWSNGANSQNVTGLAPNTYICNVTDSLGCRVNYSGTVQLQGGAIAIASSVVNDQCNQHNGSIDITVTGGTQPYSYVWSNGSTSQDLTGLATGSYHVTVTDASGCQRVQTVQVGQGSGTLSITSANITAASCGASNGAIDLTVSSGASALTYLWSNGSTSQDLNGVAAGTYSVTVTSGTGCTTTASYTVGNLSSSLAIGSVVLSHEACGNGQGAIDVTITGGQSPFSYAWSNGATTQDLSGISAGTYSLTVTDGAGCVISSASYQVLNNTGTLASSHSLVDELCGNAGGAIDLTVTGGQGPYTYLWSNGANTQDLSGLSGGTYAVTITDGLGCQMHNTYTILNSQGDLQVQSSTVSNPRCGAINGSIALSATSSNMPLSYLWSTGASSSSLSGLPAGSYTVTITDNNGCQIVENYTLVAISSTFSFGNVQIVDDFCSFGFGEIYVTASSTGGAVTYSIPGFGSNNNGTFFGLQGGSYTITLTDQSGCSTDTTVVVGSQAPFSISLVGIQDATCGTCNNGGVNINVVGQGPFQYQWSNGATTQDLTNVLPGTYTVTVMDFGGCEVVETYTVGVSTAMQIEDGYQLTVFPNPSQGIFKLEYDWSVEENFSIAVYNLLGQPVLDLPEQVGRQGSLEFDLSDYPSGTYILQIRVGEKLLNQRIRTIR